MVIIIAILQEQEIKMKNKKKGRGKEQNERIKRKRISRGDESELVGEGLKRTEIDVGGLCPLILIE